MQISIEIHTKTTALTKSIKGRAILSGSRQSLEEKVVQDIQDSFQVLPEETQFVDSLTIETQATRYSEQMVFDPLDQIDQYFSYKAGAYIGTGFPPLFYSIAKRKPVNPNVSAVAAIGEAVAGFIAKRKYKLYDVCRPNYDYPDIVMVDDQRTEAYLIEAKATIKDHSTTILNPHIARFSNLIASANEYTKFNVTGLLIGTEIRAVDDYRCQIYEIKSS